MASVKVLAVAGSAVLLSLDVAGAADLAPLPPPLMSPPVVQDFGGWYLRGDVGFSSERIEQLTPNATLASLGIVTLDTPVKSFDGAAFVDVGVGYQFNSWFRADVIGEYRTGANFHGAHNFIFQTGIPGTPTAPGVDVYSASHSAFLAMANVYADLGTWWCITPFIGAGVGVVDNRISDFVDVGFNPIGGSSVGFAPDTTQWNFAWALHAGLAYKVTPGMTVELAYRYLNMEHALSGPMTSFDGLYHAPGLLFDTLQSHDVKLGVRWQCCEDIPPAPPPLVVRKG